MPRRSKRFFRAVRVPFEWAGIVVGIAVLSRLPHRWLFALCDFASAVMYRFDSAGRRLALFNLRAVRGDATTPFAALRTMEFAPTRREEAVVRRSYRNMARTIGHAFWTCRKAKERAAEVGELAEECKRILAENRPIVTVSAHLGCWEILSQLVHLQGYRMMSVAKDVGTPGMTELLMKSRRSIGQEIVHADGAFRPLMQGIREGADLGLLVDQVVKVRDGGIWVRFFGRAMPVSAAPAFFAAKAKAPIVVAWSRPLKDGRYRCEFIDFMPAAEARDVWGCTQRCLSALERVIRRHPSCWVLNYRYFRKAPTPEELAELEKREAKGR